MRITPFLVLSISFLVACHQEVEVVSSDCIQNGFFSPDQQLELSGVKMDSVQFSDGTYHYSIDGNLSVSSTQYPFTVLLDRAPNGVEQLTVLSAGFPFKAIDSSVYTCYVYRAQNMIIIDWENAVKRLKVSVNPALL